MTQPLTKIVSAVLATMLAFGAITVPAVADETTTATTESAGPPTKSDGTDFEYYPPVWTETREEAWRRLAPIYASIPWNLGSAVIGSSTLDLDLTSSFVPDSWMLKLAIRLFALPPLSWIFPDQTKNQATLRGLFGSHWAADDQHMRCSRDLYPSNWPEPGSEDEKIFQRCSMGYSNNPVDRLHILWNTVTSS
ncbi:MAG: hypothetical protein Q3962_01365 [Corynebacterium sp.]|nr:hypothetical protein [Corynebacterium sp.]